MRTLTEKYNAVLQENYSKSQFVRDARLSHPNLITQFNGFEDTVQILKNKGMISEAKAWIMGKDYPGYGQVVSIEKEDDLVHVTFSANDEETTFTFTEDPGDRDKWVEVSEIVNEAPAWKMGKDYPDYGQVVAIEKEDEKVHVTFFANGEETTYTFVEDPGDRDKWVEISETVNEEVQKYKAEKSPEYQYISNTEDMFSFETIERAIDFELEEKGFDTVSIDYTKDDYTKAKKKALKNLEKNSNHYLDLLAGNNTRTKRHDEYTEVKKDNHVDTYNGMKKAELREALKKLVVKILKEQK